MKRFMVLLASFAAFATSCSNLPSRIDVPDFDPTDAADRAIEQYDRDSDGMLTAAEIDDAPALAAAAKTIDTNGDGVLEQAELANRFQSWIDKRQALFIVPCQVLRRGQPLAGAQIRFIPPPFLGESFRPAGGTTNANGTASIVHAPEDRPDPDFAQGLGVGLYRVEVSKVVDGQETIPLNTIASRDSARKSPPTGPAWARCCGSS